MELWIRSQNKEVLMKTTELRYNQKKEDYSILAYDTRGDYRLLGIYKNKERALEILDEIEKLLRPQIIIQQHNPVGEIDGNLVYKSEDFKCDIQELSTVVYQMPLE